MSKETSFDADFAEIKEMQRETRRMMKDNYDRMDKLSKQTISERFSLREISIISLTIVLSYLLAKFVL